MSPRSHRSFSNRHTTKTVKKSMFSNGFIRLEDRMNPVTFSNPVHYTTPSNAISVACGDFNGDGFPDVACTSSGGVTTFINNGKGTLTLPTTMGFGGGSGTRVRVADMNGDGKLDLVISGSTSETISILRGRGDGTFQAPVVCPVGPGATDYSARYNILDFSIGDFNGDGLLDVVAVTTASGMAVMMNTGTSSFLGSPTYYTAGTNNSYGTVEAGDFNRDGKNDIAYTNYDSTGKQQLSIFTNNGKGLFTQTNNIPTGATLNPGGSKDGMIAIDSTGKPLDFNGDGIVDLATAYPSNGFIGIFLGNGDGTFQTQKTFTTGASLATRLTAADFDGDGKLDLTAATNADGGYYYEFTVMLGQGGGNFSSPVYFPHNESIADVQAADFNGDGLPDLAFSIPYSPGFVQIVANTTSFTQNLSSLSITAPVTTTAGAPFSITITAKNQLGGIFTGYDGTVHFTGSDFQGILPADYTFTPADNGQHTFFNVVQKTAGLNSIMATDTVTSSITGTTSFTVTSSTAANLSLVSGSGQSTVVNTLFASNLVAKVTDDYGNPVSNTYVTFAGPMVGASADFLSGPVTVTDSNGLATAYPSANFKAGFYSVNATVNGIGNAVTYNLTNTPGAAFNIAAVFGGGQTAVVTNTFSSDLIAIVSDQFGNAVSGASVTFSAPSTGASATFPSGAKQVSDGTGLVSVSVAANQLSGSYFVNATANGVSFPASFVLSNTVGAASSIQIISGNNQSTAISSAFPFPLVAKVVDAYGNGVSGVTVALNDPTLGATASFSTGSSTMTDSNGLISVIPVANSITGSYTVTATPAGVSTPVTFNLTNTAGAPSSIQIYSGNAQSTTVNTNFAAPLVAKVIDSYGNGVAGITVNVSAPVSGASALFTAGTFRVSDLNGLISIPVQANTTAGLYTITATASGFANPLSFTLTNTPGIAASIRSISGSGQSTLVNTPFGSSLVAKVADSFGNAVSGVTVSFTDPLSGATATFPSSATAVSDGNGQVSVSLNANTVTGKYVVNAAANGVSTPTSFNLTNTAGAAANLQFVAGSGQTAVVNTAYAGLVAKVTDAFGNPVTGATVSFSNPTTGAYALFPVGSSALTDATGQATVSPVANTVTGGFTVYAKVTGIANGVTYSLTNTPGAAASINLISGNGQSTTVNTTFVPLVAKVFDAFGNVVPGVSVSFTDPNTGASANFPAGSTPVTDSTGQVSVTPVANTTAGSYTIAATASGLATPLNFAMTNTPGAVSSLSLVSGGGQSTIVNTAFASPLIAKVTDVFGNAVPGVTVTFADPTTGASAALSASKPVTDANGQVSINPTANTTAGSYNVTASVSGVSPSISYSLTNVHAAASNFNIVSGNGQAVKLSTAFPTPLAVKVTDAFGNAVSGVSVTFSSPTTGATAIISGSSTQTTDANGLASVSITANGLEGSYQVSAVASGLPTGVTFNEKNNSPGANLVGNREFAVGSDSSVNYFNANGKIQFTVTPFPGFTGGIRTATGDFNGDGIADLVVGTGPGSASHVIVYDGVTQGQLFTIDPFEASFTGGVFVAAGDINGDGKVELAITPDQGGGPRVRVFDGSNFTQIADFYGIDDPNFRGGARPAIGDVNGDGKGDLVVAAGFGGGPRVAAFDGSKLASNGGPKLFNDFYAFETALQNGIFLAVGDVNGDGFADIVAGGGPGGGPRVFVIDGKALLQNGSSTLVADANFFAGNVNSRGGVRVAVKDLDGDGKADILTGAGANAGTTVSAYLSASLTPTGDVSTTMHIYSGFPGSNTNGVFVG